MRSLSSRIHVLNESIHVFYSCTLAFVYLFHSFKYNRICYRFERRYHAANTHTVIFAGIIGPLTTTLKFDSTHPHPHPHSHLVV